MSDWPTVQLREVAELITKGATPTTYGLDYVESGVTFVRVNNITDDGRLALSDCLHVNERTHALFGRSQLKVDDVLLTIAGSIGRSAVVDESALPANCNQAVALIRLKKGAEPGFVARLLSSPLGKSKIEAATVQLAQANFSLGQIGGLAFRLPGLAEQKAITGVLDTLDTTIRQTEAIIEKLKLVKQGLLHDLLTRGIDTNGELRPPQSQAPHLYKDSPLGWIPADWAVVAVASNCGLVTKGTTPAAHDMWQGEEGIRFLRVDNLTFDGGFDFGASKFRVSASTHSGTLRRSRCFPGDVLTNIVGPPLGKLGLVTDEMGEVNINQAIAVYRPGTNLLPRFLLAWLGSSISQSWLRQRAKQTSGQVNLTLALCQELPIPCMSIAEQQLIVDRVDALNRRITLESRELGKLNKLKSGLMDDLLTGRVRVTPLLDANSAPDE